MLLIDNMGDIDDNWLMVPVDVESLYTNIPHEGRLMAMAYCLQKRSIETSPSSNCILTKKYFLFEDIFYLQIRNSNVILYGTNFYVGYLENNIILNTGVSMYFENIFIWKHYIDDVFMTWKGDVTKLKHCYEFLNISVTPLKCNMEFIFFFNL